MKYLVLNGNQGEDNTGFDNYLHTIVQKLEEKGNEVDTVLLRDKKIAPCTGCFKCWTKTPGECIIADDAREIAEKYINSDMIILASPLVLGYFSALMKNTIDRSIPLMHPHLEEVDEEIHHKKRYESYPGIGILLQKEPDTDDEDMEIAHDLFRRMCINMRTDLHFVMTMDQPVEEVLDAAAVS